MPPVIKTIKKGDYLFRENDVSQDMYIIQTGKVHIFKNSGENKIDICDLQKGSVLGEMAIIDGNARSASAIATEDTEVSVITPDDFVERTQEIPHWYFTIISIISNRLRDTNRRLKKVNIQNSTGNIAAILLFVYNLHKKKVDEKYLVDLKFVKSETINILEVSLGEINKALEKFVSDKMIKIEKNMIEIFDIGKFTRYSAYLRAKFNKSDKKNISLSKEANKLLVFLCENKGKYGKEINNKLEFKIESFEELFKDTKDTQQEVFRELEEHRFIINKDNTEDTEKDYNSIIIDNDQLNEFSLIMEFEGNAINIDEIQKEVGL